MRITMCVTNSLESDHRVHKVASTLLHAGHEVKVIGCLTPGWRELEREYEIKRLKLYFHKTILFYIEFTLRVFWALLWEKCDVVWANDTDTILPCWAAGRIRGRRVVADLHELFPEVPEVVDRKLVKWVWTKVEDLCIPRVDATMTVCQSISDYYYNRYSVRPAVVRNIPNYRPYEGRGEKAVFGDVAKGRRVILYQGWVNVGRGIEWIMDAMPMVENAVFIVVGKGDLYEELKTKAAKESNGRVVFLGPRPHDELREMTIAADLGVCLLEGKGLSYYYSLPNRIFDMISAHVPILATDFPEIRRIVSEYRSGRLTSTQDAKEIAGIINEMLSEERDDDVFERAARELCWENEEAKVQGMV